MRRITLLLSCFALLTPALALADDFQGTVHMKVTSDKKAVDIDYEAKPGLMKIAMPGGQGTVVFDTNKHQMLIVMTQQHMYMTRPMPQVPDQAAAAHGGSEAKLVDTHETETILGYKCTKYTVTTGNNVTTLWATSDLGNFAGFGSGMGGGPGGHRSGPPTEWAKLVQGRGFFPMRLVETDGGTEKARMEVTAVQKQALDDSEFGPPAGYRELNMGNMMGGMGRGQ